MSDHTVTITTPSKTVALPTSRVAFVTTTHIAMGSALDHYRTVFSFGRVPQAGELSGVAALCLTPADRTGPTSCGMRLAGRALSPTSIGSWPNGATEPLLGGDPRLSEACATV